MITRYDLGEVANYEGAEPRLEPGMVEDETGIYVLYSVHQSELAALREEMAKFDEGMREIAFVLGAGGYNADSLSASQLIEKVKWGLEHHASVQEQRLTAAEQRNAELAELLSKGFNCMESSGGKYRITMDFHTGDECFEAYSALCNLCHCDTLVREPQPTESGASE